LPLHVAAWIMSWIPVISLSTNSVRFLPFTWKTPATKQQEIDDISCCKCRKNCKTRSTYWTVGDNEFHLVLHLSLDYIHLE
jgi:hypothetical protein